MKPQNSVSLTPAQQRTLRMIATFDPDKANWTIGVGTPPNGRITSPRFRALQEKGMITCQANPTWHGTRVEITEQGQTWLNENNTAL